MACKVIVNRDSGNCDRLDIDCLLKVLDCTDADVQTIDSHTNWTATGYDTVVVCGGDGTLRNAIERCPDTQIIYAPCGTLNETSHTDSIVSSVGCVNGTPFGYVCATGSFTEIGYTAKTKTKQCFKAIAYLPQVLKNYRCHKIRAQLTVDGREFCDDYTLLMILKSHRCFGFNFNRSYRLHKGLYILAIKSCGQDCFVNRVKMFFPFFRVFFCGVSNPQIHKRWMLLPFDQLTIQLDGQRDFCLDGELTSLGGKLNIIERHLDKQIPILKTPFCNKKR